MGGAEGAVLHTMLCKIRRFSIINFRNFDYLVSIGRTDFHRDGRIVGSCQCTGNCWGKRTEQDG